MQQQTFQLTGLTCESCAKFTTKRIKQIDGVSDATVDLKSMIASVAATRPINTDEVRSSLEGTHYGVGQ